ncbi:ABC transporter substrate-binding protein [Bordetella genomosp. 12]|uniref:Iron ABC transporter substrate-binding protein n=1 Tax=Bordetella genomosp. 12 TaxID=463035 RepID=A0A261VC85_9BORD|nr:ABC transporter substrate-binding protein [Bordetella genomosp. 12]OZI71758.1 iron ABC transporter substrate-binding protein [Bordetella genomosp. 12]
MKSLRIAAVALAAALLSPAVLAREVTDLAGRQVQIPDRPQRILLGEGRFVFAMALLDRANPVARIAGWQGELKAQDPQAWKQLLDRYPQAADIPFIGKNSEASVSPERIVSLHPDLAIFGLSGHGPGPANPMIAALQSAGIPILFIDFRAKPLEHTLPSLRLLGQALGREREAEDYIAFAEQRRAAVDAVVSAVPAERRPRVFVEMLAGVWPACCHTTGGGGLGDMVAAAGGRNIARDLVPGAIGDVSLEFLLKAQPDVYVATGSRSEPGRPGIMAGPGVTPQTARDSLQAVVARAGIKDLDAVRQHRAHGLWHAFYNSPYNIVAIEALAKWFYPDSNLDPQASMDRLYRDFVQLDGQGSYWTR